MNVFIVSISNEEERKRNMRIRNGFEEFFCLRSNLSNDDNFCQKARSENGYGFYGFGLKMGLKNDIRYSILIFRFHPRKRKRFSRIGKFEYGRIWFGKITFAVTHVSTSEENDLKPFTCNRTSNQFTVDHKHR